MKFKIVILIIYRFEHIGKNWAGSKVEQGTVNSFVTSTKKNGKKAPGRPKPSFFYGLKLEKSTPSGARDFFPRFLVQLRPQLLAVDVDHHQLALFLLVPELMVNDFPAYRA